MTSKTDAYRVILAYEFEEGKKFPHCKLCKVLWADADWILCSDCMTKELAKQVEAQRRIKKSDGDAK
jgi:hypothetical protein